MSIDTDRFRALLTEERDRVQRALTHLEDEHSGSIEDETDELATAADNHMSDVASTTLDREIDYSLEANSEQHLGAIDAALKRIDDGTYGKCVVGGEDIGEERLEAMPWASLCIVHAREREQRR